MKDTALKIIKYTFVYLVFKLIIMKRDNIYKFLLKKPKIEVLIIFRIDSIPYKYKGNINYMKHS